MGRYFKVSLRQVDQESVRLRIIDQERIIFGGNLQPTVTRDLPQAWIFILLLPFRSGRAGEIIAKDQAFRRSSGFQRWRRSDG